MLKVGDYVRFKNGTITKINSFSEKDNPLFNILINAQYYNSSDIKVSSPRIIDLVQVGDYVNGYQVFRWYDGDLVLFDSGYSILKEIKITSIVTKEQFESMEYKVGENQC